MLAAAALLVYQGCQSKDPSARPPVRTAPERIVSFVPGLTEVAFDMDLGGKFVGVSDYDTYPPAVTKIEKVGGVIDPNLEKLVALQADLILIQPSQKKVQALADERGVPTVAVPTDTLSDVFASYLAIGAAAGVPEVGRQRAAALRARIEAASAPPGSRRPRVLLVVGRQPGTLEGMTVAGRGSFLDELLTMAGGVNALGETPTKWPQVNKEVLLGSPPEVIVELSPGASADPAQVSAALKAWSTLGAIEAVKAGRVYRLNGQHLLLPGPRAVETVRDLRRLLDGVR
jgi:iron complex transport system substrate-binding protein